MKRDERSGTWLMLDLDDLEVVSGGAGGMLAAFGSKPANHPAATPTPFSGSTIANVAITGYMTGTDLAVEHTLGAAATEGAYAATRGVVGGAIGGIFDVADHGLPDNGTNAASFALKNGIEAGLASTGPWGVGAAIAFDHSIGYVADSLTGGNRYAADSEGSWAKEAVDGVHTLVQNFNDPTLNAEAEALNEHAEHVQATLDREAVMGPVNDATIDGLEARGQISDTEAQHLHAMGLEGGDIADGIAHPYADESDRGFAADYDNNHAADAPADTSAEDGGTDHAHAPEQGADLSGSDGLDHTDSPAGDDGGGGLGGDPTGGGDGDGAGDGGGDPGSGG